MNRDEADQALRRLRDERDRITSVLLDLEGQQGYRLLKGAALTGETARRWTDLSRTMTSLWRLFEAYGGVLARAEELRAQRSRPDLAELGALLAGPSVELPSDIPLERRTLLGPSTERLTLDAVVTRMTPLYEEAARAIAAVDASWSALLSRLGEVEDEARTVRGLLDSLGGDPDRRARGAREEGSATIEPEFDRIDGELGGLRETVRTDPLSITPAAFDGVAAALTDLRPRLEAAVRFRAEHEERVRRIGESIGLIRAAEEEARQERERALAKIASPLPHEPAELSGPLADRLAALDALRGRWTELAARVADLERATATALERARQTVRTITGLIERRDELRGRLDAYRAKAGRLGRLEDPELTELYQRARDLLWTAPCDLRQATASLAEYQRAIGDRT
jgi:chromosome segregation ATPase